jgi:hypothetical protein
MKAIACLSALALIAGGAHAQEPVKPSADAAPAVGEPLPAGAPSEPYELASWCYGALDQYLYVYENIIPQLKDIDKMFGSSVKNEARPYADDMAAAALELKVLSAAVTAAEKASAQVITPRGAAAVVLGRSIWTPAESRTKRELARAWLSWALPDACAANARDLKAKSDLLGQALKYNATSATESPRAPVTTPEDAAPAPAATPEAGAPAAATPPVADAPHAP